MRWPWVSREVLDHVADDRAFWYARYREASEQLRESETARRELVGRCFAQTEEIARLTAQVEALTPKPAPVLGAAVPREKSLIAEAIKEESGGDPRLAAWFRKRVKEMKADGKSDGDIIAEIRKWESTEPQSLTSS